MNLLNFPLLESTLRPRQDVRRSCLVWLSTSARRRASAIHTAEQTLKNLGAQVKPRGAVHKLPNHPARTRFAPSPTGYLHLGSLRTALFNYLLARSTGGQFLLRIEDTDRGRTIPDAERRLYDDLAWAGLHWDEGPDVGGPYGPYRQSERTELYRTRAHHLVVSGHAYRCFCSPQRLRELAEHRSKLGLPTDYDRTCDGISAPESDERAARGDSHVIRLRVPDQYPQFTDIVYGTVGKEQRPGRRGDDAYEDPILLKSDGSPTYHLANVVDDHSMKITHVVRGTEWLSSTPKHLVMYQAFGWQPPEFAHVGLLVDEHQMKLSKRNFDVDISSYKDRKGIIPETLINFVAMLGWSHRNRTDCMSLDELIKNFSLKFTKGNTVVTADKLWFLQKYHARKRIESEDRSVEEIVKGVCNAVETRLADLEQNNLDRILGGRTLQAFVHRALKADPKSYTTADDFVDRNSYLFSDPAACTANDPDMPHSYNPDQTPPDKKLTRNTQSFAQDAEKDEISQEEEIALKPLSNLPEWTTTTLSTKINEIIANVNQARLAHPGWSSLENKQTSSAACYQFFRSALAGGRHGPPVANVMEVLGKQESLRRMRRAFINQFWMNGMGNGDDSDPFRPILCRLLGPWDKDTMPDFSSNQ